MTNLPTYSFRKATLSDCQKLQDLIIQSSQIINGKYYEENVISAAIGNIWIVDEQLILDGTYWLAENVEKEIVGCGGWSKRGLLFGNSNTTKINKEVKELNPKKDSARIRAFFVHPNHVRKGIGKELLSICEKEAKLNRFTSLELVATLSGLKLYSACGYSEQKRIDIDLGDGIYGEAVEMKKSI